MPLQEARIYLQHNVFLAYLAELGLVGLGLGVAVFACFLNNSYRLLTNPKIRNGFRMLSLVTLLLTINMVVNGCFHDVSLILMVGSLHYYVNGLTYSVSDRQRREEAIGLKRAAIAEV